MISTQLQQYFRDQATTERNECDVLSRTSSDDFQDVTLERKGMHKLSLGGCYCGYKVKKSTPPHKAQHAAWLMCELLLTHRVAYMENLPLVHRPSRMPSRYERVSANYMPVFIDGYPFEQVQLGATFATHVYWQTLLRRVIPGLPMYSCTNQHL